MTVSSWWRIVIATGHNVVQAINYSTYTTKADVWSFGILIHEIVTYGDLPYGDWNNQEV